MIRRRTIGAVAGRSDILRRGYRPDRDDVRRPCGHEHRRIAHNKNAFGTICGMLLTGHVHNGIFPAPSQPTVPLAAVDTYSAFIHCQIIEESR